MAHKILTVSILEDKIDILRLEMGMLNTYTAVEGVRHDVDVETLTKSAKWADEILINGDFSTAEHYWKDFPKVANRQLRQLVNRNAMQTLETRRAIRFGFKNHGQTTVEGVARSRVSCLASEEADVVDLEQKTFRKNRKKIRLVTSLPVSLAAAVVQSEHPKKDFMVIWSREMTTIFVISSSQGDVKVARNIPVGIDRHFVSSQENEEVLESFSKELDRDIMTTLLLYHDTFLEPSCEGFYLLGNERLQSAFEQYPLKSVGGHDTYSLDNLPVRGLNRQDSRSYNLLGTLFSQHYNLVDTAIIRERQFDVSFRYASMILIGCIVAAGAWMQLSSPSKGIEKKVLYDSKTTELNEVIDKLYVLEKKQIELSRYSGWKDFYKNTYTNQPAWSQMFSSLANIIPEQFIIKNFQIVPGKTAGVHGWTCILKGRINVTKWKDGLALFRKFGSRIHQTPFFEIVDVQYTPLDEEWDADIQETSFDFLIKLKLTPQEKK